MKFVANPVSVEAHQIQAVHSMLSDGSLPITLENGEHVPPLPPEMIARYIPVPGDYLVTQEHGYQYVNPREAFERKYAPEGSRVRFTASDDIANFLADVKCRVRNVGEPVEACVVVYGTYGGKFFVESTESGVTALGLLDIGNRTMLDAIVRPLEG
ncbi:hypothetical protein [Paraburkholderia hospita]|uniref:hypothetical protein n=1 Tax=Paraburkholderia hospita TaxID=169430 RepID=UPI0008A7F2B9|nr:hypothetical protein [Paraburkholderia hospita]SEH89642.1 hypothetical protein SAMN05192544_1011138 [Paraburkholderia hospita]